MKTLIALALMFFALKPAHAADVLVLNPNRTECRIETVDADFKSCNLYYDGLLIHEGRSDTKAIVNGDFVKCRTLVETAKTQNANLIMSREKNRFNIPLDWYDENFLMIAAPGSTP